jgi:hypothetical protein
LKESDRMAKISKRVLKSVVKDCLVEILQEGLMGSHSPDSSRLSNSDQISALNEHKTRSSTKNRAQSSTPRRTGLDNISYYSQEQTSRQIDESKIKAVSQSLTSDPVMSSIFEDTARTTLQEQYQAERAGPAHSQGDAASRKAAVSNPDELFGESADKWAALAFSDKS